MNLPMLLGVVSMAMISGVVITLIGYYVPFMIMSTVVASIGMGVLATLNLTRDLLLGSATKLCSDWALERV
jgi:hypothetical protein